MELHEVKEITRQIILEIIALDGNTAGKAAKFGDDDSLIDGGHIDSIGAVQLVEGCIQNFDILIHPAELSLENFDTINKICQFVKLKLDENHQ